MSAPVLPSGTGRRLILLSVSVRIYPLSSIFSNSFNFLILQGLSELTRSTTRATYPHLTPKRSAAKEDVVVGVDVGVEVIVPHHLQKKT